jgi:hypothetical protein
VAHHVDGSPSPGHIPTEIGQLRHLTQLFLSENQLTGVCVVAVGMCAVWAGACWYDSQDLCNGRSGRACYVFVCCGANWLIFTENKLIEGTIPTEIGRLAQLSELDLRSNQLTGA